MLTVLIGGNLTLSHDFMKRYTRKPANFLEKSMSLFVVHKSNDETYYKLLPSMVFDTHVGNSRFQ